MKEPLVHARTGTYTGTIDNDGSSQAVTGTITASGDNDIVIRYQTSNISTTFDPLPVTNCMIERMKPAGGVTASVMTARNSQESDHQPKVTRGMIGNQIFMDKILILDCQNKRYSIVEDEGP